MPNDEKSIIKISDREKFKRKVLEGKGIRIVRFCTVWSGPCQIMGPIYLEMFSTFKKAASFYRVDVDEAPLLKSDYGIIEIPTILLFKNGKVIDFAIGLISRDALIAKIKEWVI